MTALAEIPESAIEAFQQGWDVSPPCPLGGDLHMAASNGELLVCFACGGTWEWYEVGKVGEDLEERMLAEVPDEKLLSELDWRATLVQDQPPGTSRQICPRCSGIKHEVFGNWDRKTLQFKCEACGFSAAGDGYEGRLEDYYADCWWAKQDQQSLDAAVRELRRVTR